MFNFLYISAKIYKKIGNFRYCIFFRILLTHESLREYEKSDPQIRFREVFAVRNLCIFDKFAKKRKKIIFVSSFYC
jgi:hypothetical protein